MNKGGAVGYRRRRQNRPPSPELPQIFSRPCWAKTISGRWAVAGLFRVGHSSVMHEESLDCFVYRPTKFVTRALHRCIHP